MEVSLMKHVVRCVCSALALAVCLAVPAANVGWGQVKVQVEPGKVDVNVGGKDQPVDDQTFVKKAALIDLEEIMLGEIGSKQAKHPEVKKFAMKMVQDHTKSSQE